MKKNNFILKAIFVVSAVLFLFSASPSFGGEIKVIIDGKQVQLSSPARTQKGLVYVPMRNIFEKLGAKIKFDYGTNTVIATKDKNKVELNLTTSVAKINGFSSKMIAPPLAFNEVTFVPLRFVGEALGCDVSWHPPTNTVTITTKKSSGKKKSDIEEPKIDNIENPFPDEEETP